MPPPAVENLRREYALRGGLGAEFVLPGISAALAHD
jgi:hypothetical protein